MFQLGHWTYWTLVICWSLRLGHYCPVISQTVEAVYDFRFGQFRSFLWKTPLLLGFSRKSTRSESASSCEDRPPVEAFFAQSVLWGTRRPQSRFESLRRCRWSRRRP